MSHVKTYRRQKAWCSVPRPMLLTACTASRVACAHTVEIIRCHGNVLTDGLFIHIISIERTSLQFVLNIFRGNSMHVVTHVISIPAPFSVLNNNKGLVELAFADCHVFRFKTFYTMNKFHADVCSRSPQSCSVAAHLSHSFLTWFSAVVEQEIWGFEITCLVGVLEKS